MVSCCNSSAKEVCCGATEFSDRNAIFDCVSQSSENSPQRQHLSTNELFDRIVQIRWKPLDLAKRPSWVGLETESNGENRR